MNLRHIASLSSVALFLSVNALGQDQRVRVSVENLAPSQGTFQTPVWIGFHDGSFDLYDRGVPLGDILPNHAVERLAEDGTTDVLAGVFLRLGAGLVEGTLPGPNGPIAPGDIASRSFLLDPTAPTSRYLSYASMLIPSNDAFLANGNPMALQIFSDRGRFIAPDFFDLGSDILDAGTEVNDELPENTAFFGQKAPNTGVDEDGVVGSHAGFLRPGSGGILDDFRFREGDFVDSGYPAIKIRVESAPAITEFRAHIVGLSGREEVPSVDTRAFGIGLVTLNDDGTKIRYFFRFFNLKNVVAAHLHLAPAGSNGAVVASLLAPQTPGGGRFRRLEGEIDVNDLVGPFAAMPLDALSAALGDGNIYVNIHTDDGDDSTNGKPGDNPSGEIRGQVTLF